MASNIELISAGVLTSMLIGRDVSRASTPKTYCKFSMINWSFILKSGSTYGIADNNRNCSLTIELFQHNFFTASVPMYSMYDANPSFNHRAFHLISRKLNFRMSYWEQSLKTYQSIVTRLPNKKYKWFKNIIKNRLHIIIKELSLLRLPNHWWDNSWAIMIAANWNDRALAVLGSVSRYCSLHFEKRYLRKSIFCFNLNVYPIVYITDR